MPDRILSFRLSGYALGVEEDQVEKILINKHPSMDEFTLETGVEVRSLKGYVPLPPKEEVPAENILFIKGQKDYYGFSVDGVDGYLKLKGGEPAETKRATGPVKYYIRSGETFIPVLNLEDITNEAVTVDPETIEEIIGYSQTVEDAGAQEPDSVFQDVSQEEVYRSIEAEIEKEKRSYSDDIVRSAKSGVMLPIVLNVVLIAVFASILTFYLTVSREKLREQVLSGSITGVEEEVIREIKRRSEEEVRKSKEKLNEAKKRLTALQEERDFFLANQDKILSEKEQEIADEYERKLEEARNRFLASGSENAELEFEEEKQRLNNEYQQQIEDTRSEIEKIKDDYENALQARENEIKNEVDLYTKKISDIEQQLVEERSKLKETEERFQSAVTSQEEYLAFRKQINRVYDRALTQISRDNYDRGIAELSTLLPILERARRTGLGEEEELKVEEKLVGGILDLAESEKNQIKLNDVAERMYDSADGLEKSGNMREALSRYYTAYSISDSDRLRERSLRRAESIIESFYDERREGERVTMESEAEMLFDTAAEYRRAGDYTRAMQVHEKLITELPGTERSGQSLQEIDELQDLVEEGVKTALLEQLNEEALKLMTSGHKAYDTGYYTEALERYEEVVRSFGESDYVEEALDRIVSINEDMRNIKTGPSIVMGRDSKTGVIIQIPTESTFLFNLGSQDGLSKGDVVGIYRRDGKSLSYIGSVKVYEVYPTISKGKVMYFETRFKVGDVVSPS